MYSISPSGGKVIVGACVVCACVLPIASSEASIAREPARVPPDDAPVRIEEEAEALGVNATRAKFPRAFMASAGIESVEGTWMSQGPGPTRLGQVENVSPNNEVVGAIHTVAAHPTDANILYAGAVNGGVWKTTNATAASPNWSPLTDDQASLSIGALEFDPTDGTSNTLWAGIGRFSSFFRGGTRTGLLSTIDGGTTWTPINGGGTLVDKNISGVAVRGNTVVVSMNDATSFFADIGIYRSVDGGSEFLAAEPDHRWDAQRSLLRSGKRSDQYVEPVHRSCLYRHFRGTGGCRRNIQVGGYGSDVDESEQRGNGRPSSRRND